MHGVLRAGVAVLLAALLVVGLTAAGAGVAAASHEAGHDGPEPADEIYVDEDGDAVLVYEDDARDSEVEMGVDVGAGIFHALVESDTGVESEVTGSGTAVLTSDEFDGNGSVQFPRPDALSALSVDVSGEHTDEDSQFDATAHARVDAGDAGGLPVERATAEGEATVEASTFSASGQLDATLSERVGDDRHHRFTVTETDGTYDLSADESYVVPEYAAYPWETRERAEQTLRDRYAGVADELGGEARVELESYSFTELGEGRYRLDVEYSVTYEGVEEGLVREVTRALAESESVDLDESELSDIEARLGEVTLEEVHAAYEQRGTDVSADFRVRIDEYDEVVRAGLDVAEALDVEADGEAVDLSEDVQEARDRLDAQEAADLRRTYALSVAVESVSRSELTVDLESSYRTENWQAYVAELEDRGIERTDLTYELTAEHSGEQIESSVAVEVRQEDLVESASDALLGLASGQDPELERYVQAFRDAGFEKARVDVDVSAGTVRFEGATAFENMTALQEALADSEQLPAFASAVARTDNGTTTTYVRVPGATEPDADEATVRELAYVDADTEVHLAGTWNRTFPEADTAAAREYLGLTPTPEPGDDGGIVADGPGFGAPAAIVALLTTVALLARRRS